MKNLTLWRILFIVCVFITLYFIFSLAHLTLKDYKIIEPYIYSDVSLIYNTQEIEDAMDYMITNVYDDLIDIDNKFNYIKEKIYDSF